MDKFGISGENLSAGAARNIDKQYGNGDFVPSHLKPALDKEKQSFFARHLTMESARGQGLIDNKDFDAYWKRTFEGADAQKNLKLLGSMPEKFTKDREIIDKIVTERVTKLKDVHFGKEIGAVLREDTAKVNPRDGLDRFMSAVGETKQVSSSVGEATLKSIAKKLPGVSVVAAGVLAADRANAGDYVGASMEVASGVAGSVPVVGTVASIAIDAALMARDMGREPSTGMKMK